MSPLDGQPIYLAGFMATGKTKVGRILAERLGRPFVDTDDMVVERAGKPITEIFEQDGEPAFRRMERTCVSEASQMTNAVVALGGGAVTQEANWATIRNTGLCLCLRASPETISNRVSRNDKRPLMADLDEPERLNRIRRILAERDPCYARADAFVTSTDDRTPEETADLVLSELLRAARAKRD